MFNKPRSNYLTLDFKKVKVKDEQISQPQTHRINTSRTILRKLRVDGCQTDRDRNSYQEVTNYTQEKLIYKQEFEDERKRKLEQLRCEVEELKLDYEQKQKELIQSRKQVNNALKGLVNSHTKYKDYQIGDVKLYQQYYRCKTETPFHLKNTIYDAQKYQNYYGKLQKANLKLNHQVQFAMIQYRKQLEESQQRIPNFLKSIQQVL
ncbi:unnamed protein product [Paramecium pentaurelia]|uniref:Uncharacterized protein n=1 Tax=Paramecium pentaurelia TaxID=43138 RepID=A0A8S1TJ90_9CILI|nr:unnamed protein product [Paramecium pentaurelia]